MSSSATPTGATDPAQVGRSGGAGRDGGFGSRGLLLGVVALVLALVLGTAAFASFRVMSGRQTQPADVLPANALAYVTVDLEASANQQQGLDRLIRKFPALSLVGINGDSQDMRRQAFQLFLRSHKSCSALSYAKSVAPWLGDRVGVAVLPPVAGAREPGVAVAVQVSDQSAAEAGVRALAKCSDSDPVAHTAVGDYMLLAKTQALVDRYSTEAARHPLSKAPALTADMARLGEQGMVTAWFSVDRILAAVPAKSLPAGITPADNKGASSGAVTMRFNEHYLELAGVTSGGRTDVDVPANPVVNLPDSTVLALSGSGGADQVATMWSTLASSLKQSGQSLDVLTQQVEQQTGLVLPADLKTVLGSNITAALDSSGLDLSQLMQPAGDLSSLQMGARFQTDPGAFHIVLDKLVRYAKGQGLTLPLRTTDGDGFVTVASTNAYADQLAADGSLGDDPAFQLAVPDARSSVSALYFNFDLIQPQLVSAMRQGGVPGLAIDSLEPIAGLGMSSTVPAPGQSAFTMRLTVN